MPAPLRKLGVGALVVVCEGVAEYARREGDWREVGEGVAEHAEREGR